MSRSAAVTRARSRALELGGEMLEEAVERSRPRTVADRLRANSGWFVQAALATSMAWVLAQVLFGHERPIFAPVAALIGVSAWLGQRRRAAIEMMIGIALGIGIADVLVSLIGTGPLQIAAVVTLAMVAAVALGAASRSCRRRRPRRCSWSPSSCPAAGSRACASSTPFSAASSPSP